MLRRFSLNFAILSLVVDVVLTLAALLGVGLLLGGLLWLALG